MRPHIGQSLVCFLMLTWPKPLRLFSSQLTGMYCMAMVFGALTFQQLSQIHVEEK